MNDFYDDVYLSCMNDKSLIDTSSIIAIDLVHLTL